MIKLSLNLLLHLAALQRNIRYRSAPHRSSRHRSTEQEAGRILEEFRPQIHDLDPRFVRGSF